MLVTKYYFVRSYKIVNGMYVSLVQNLNGANLNQSLHIKIIIVNLLNKYRRKLCTILATNHTEICANSVMTKCDAMLIN